MKGLTGHLMVALACALCSCAPMLRQTAGPEAGFNTPRLEPQAFVSFDGARLGLTRWEALGDAPWAVIVGVHGMNDYANAFHLAGPWWAARGVTTYAYDQRGFGRSPGRGIWAPDAATTEDLRTLVTLARRRHPGALIAVVGESLGGAVAVEAFASDRPPDADRLILVAPAVWGWTSQPLINRATLWLAAHIAPGRVFAPPRWLTNHIAPTDNIAELRAMSRDPLLIWGARADALYGLMNTMQRAQRRMAALPANTLYLYGAHDQIIPKSPTRLAARRLPPGDRSAYYDKGWHLLLADLQAPTVWGDVLAFIHAPTDPLPSKAPEIVRALARFTPPGA